MTTPEKAALRAGMMKRLREMTAEDREAASDELCERVLEMTPWAEAQSAVLFVPMPSEPIITPLKLDCDARKVSCVTLAQSTRTDTELQLPASIDLILVPGVAFSTDRHRLGRGGGFFDRLLAGPAANAFKLGVCFSFQMIESVPTESQDVVMDAIVTDQRVFL
ncbi:MAG: 5-formyltetrahydrofolate cyclo-ligase [Verrucomicrobiota bacterium]|jgi:5-formyltetrahydrofolate cyclo-ligase